MNKQQIVGELLDKHQRFANFILALSEEDFVFSANEKWTAGQQLDHIVRGVSPVALAFSLPKFVPKIAFGKANRDSMDYDGVVTKYQAKLAAGGKATGRFIPPKIGFEMREKLQQKLIKTVGKLCSYVESYPDQHLEINILPHPILGKLTFLEMLYFTIYHVQHHHKAVLQNLETK